MFYKDLAANKLPQWMFITPNMSISPSITPLSYTKWRGERKKQKRKKNANPPNPASDGHDTSVTTAGKWSSAFLTPLLTNPSFNKHTLVLLTFDENHTYTAQNRVLALLLGDCIPASLVGTTDTSYYNHYSALATVEANWGLHTLGRWDVGANVFKFAAAKTGDVVRAWSSANSRPLADRFFNQSYPGLFNTANRNVPLPVPNTAEVYNGRTVLQKIKDGWAFLQSESYYTTALEIPDGLNPPVYP